MANDGKTTLDDCGPSMTFSGHKDGGAPVFEYIVGDEERKKKVRRGNKQNSIGTTMPFIFRKAHHAGYHFIGTTTTTTTTTTTSTSTTTTTLLSSHNHSNDI